MHIQIEIAKEFSSVPIGRYLTDSDHSGEAFREKLLLPRFKEAEKSGQLLQIDFTGMKCLSSSFLEEAFGGLVRKTKQEPKLILERIRFVPEGTHLDEYIENTKRFIERAGEK